MVSFDIFKPDFFFCFFSFDKNGRKLGFDCVCFVCVV